MIATYENAQQSIFLLANLAEAMLEHSIWGSRLPQELLRIGLEEL